RRVPLIGELAELIERRWQARKVGDSICPLVFHRAGRPICDFRDSWATACEAAGHPGLLFHDLRRSAVSNATAAGCDQKTAMQLSGHKTITVFLRYNITSDDAMREALQKIEARSK